MTVLVVDTSAVVAVLSGEAGSGGLLRALADAERRVISAATLVELGIVVEARFGPAGRGLVDRFLRDGEIDVVELDGAGADRAVDGWRRFGRGRHAAALNLGDCFTYGLAVGVRGAVLCVGEGYSRTDISVVRP